MTVTYPEQGSGRENSHSGHNLLGCHVPGPYPELDSNRNKPGKVRNELELARKMPILTLSPADFAVLALLDFSMAAFAGYIGFRLGTGWAFAHLDELLARFLIAMDGEKAKKLAKVLLSMLDLGGAKGGRPRGGLLGMAKDGIELFKGLQLLQQPPNPPT